MFMAQSYRPEWRYLRGPRQTESGQKVDKWEASSGRIRGGDGEEDRRGGVHRGAEERVLKRDSTTIGRILSCV